MTLFVRSLFVAALLFCFVADDRVRVFGQDMANAISLHPENHRYFVFRGKPTVLVTSAEHYGLLLNRAFDFEAYLDELASLGLNHTRVFSGAYREVGSSFGITQNTLAPSDENYISPWKRQDQNRPDQKRPDGSPLFDLERWNEDYFTRLESIMKAASRRGIVVEMCLFCPMYKPELWAVNPMNIRNNVNHVGDCGPNEVYTTKHQDLLRVQSTLAEKIVEALLPFDNVYIEICNEPYFGGVTDAWQRRMIDVIVAKQKQIGSQKLISINVANKSKRIEDPHPAISIFNFHYCHPPVVIADNQHIQGVIGENETGFRGKPDFLYRTEGWDFLVAGGAIYNNLDYSFSVQHPTGTLDAYQSPGGGSRQLRQQLAILKATFDQLPLPKLQPLPDTFVHAPKGLIASAIGQPGKAYLIYLHVELPGRLNDQPIHQYTAPNENVQLQIDLPVGSYQIKQIDTQSGKTSNHATITVTGGQPIPYRLSKFTTDTAVIIE